MTRETDTSEIPAGLRRRLKIIRYVFFKVGISMLYRVEAEQEVVGHTGFEPVTPTPPE